MILGCSGLQFAHMPPVPHFVQPIIPVERSLPDLLPQVRACQICAAHLPLPPRPVLQAGSSARILIASQAPGSKVHASGRPFTDASGDRLRAWMGVTREVFYDAQQIALLPMGLCFPGTGKSGDLPPRPECASQVAHIGRTAILNRLPNIELTLMVGQYAIGFHLPHEKGTLTDTVQRWRAYFPERLPMPHPSPRNQLWLRRNPWFETEVIPALQARVRQLLA